MAFEHWTHQFCLACDKQTDGATYCSESCRLSDFEKTSSTPSSEASSPGFASPSYPWTTTSPFSPVQQPTHASKFYLSPAYDFSNPRPYGVTSTYAAIQSRPQTASLAPAHRGLTPSSSHSSLCSMQSTASADSAILSDKAKRELRAYAVSFEQVRLQRRRSY